MNEERKWIKSRGRFFLTPPLLRARIQFVMLERIVKKNKPLTRIILVILGVCGMGLGLYFLDHIKFGTDSWSTFNLAISRKTGVDYGTTILVANLIAMIFVVIFGRREIGIGTVANMVLVGYTKDFCEWVFGKVIPDSFYEPFLNRCLIFIPAMIWFVLAVSLYVSANLGTSPFDAIPNILSARFKKIPFMYIRIAYDALWAVLGFFLGGTVGAVTVLIALFLGPCITLVRKQLVKHLGF